MPGKNPRKRSEIDWQALRDLHAHGASFRGLSQTFEIALSTICDHARRNGWKRSVEPNKVDKYKTKEQLLAETDRFIAIAAKNLAEHLSKLTGKHIGQYSAQLRTLSEIRARVFGPDNAQVARKNGKRNDSPNYFGTTPDELRSLATETNGPDTGSGEPSREILND
jgi:hypothetical protein